MARSGCCGGGGIMPVINDTPDAQGHSSVAVNGTGTAVDPFLINFVGLARDVDPSGFVVTTITFNPTTGYHIEVAIDTVNSLLRDIGDVHAPSPADGTVLSWDATNHWWHPVNPTTAAAGSVLTGNGLAGDGSSGASLDVQLDTDSGLAIAAGGLRLDDTTFQSLVRHFSDDTARDAGVPVPAINSLSALDAFPGEIDYWDGTQWQPLCLIADTQGTEYLQLSGPFEQGTAVTIFTKILDDVTDASGVVTVLADTDLTGAAGVLSVQVQPLLDPSYTTGMTTWLMSLDPTASDIEVIGVAFATDGTGEWSSQPVSAVVTALLY